MTIRYISVEDKPSPCVIESGRYHKEEWRVFLGPEYDTHGTQYDDVGDFIPQ